MSRKRRDREYLVDLAGLCSALSPMMGEAVKKLSASVKEMHPHLPWKQMAGMRDKVVHDYFGINHVLSGRWPRKNSQYCCPL